MCPVLLSYKGYDQWSNTKPKAVVDTCRHVSPHNYPYKFVYRSVVCTCSGAYMRAEIGNENLVVCLSEYVPIYVIIGLKYHLGLPVVREVGGVVTMKLIDMYIAMIGAFHLVRTQFYMLSGPTHPLFACNTQWKCIGGLRPPPLGAYVINGRPHSSFSGLLCVKGKSCSRRFRFTLFPQMRRVGIGLNRILVFGLSGVMISIKSIDLHIGHGRSVRVCITKRLRIYRIGKMPWLASCLSVPQ